MANTTSPYRRSATTKTTKKVIKKKKKHKCANFKTCKKFCRAGRKEGEVCEKCARKDKKQKFRKKLRKCEPCSIRKGASVQKRDVVGGRCSPCRKADRRAEPDRKCAKCDSSAAVFKVGDLQLCNLCAAATRLAVDGVFTQQVRPSRTDFRAGTAYALSRLDLVHAFILVRRGDKIWYKYCVFLLFRYVLFVRYGLIAALLEPVTKKERAQAVAKKVAAAFSFSSASA